MGFNIGDRVRCVSGKWYDDVKGLVGTVVLKDLKATAEDIGIDFGVEKYNLHRLDGELKRPTGYYIKSKDLVLAKKGNIDFYRKEINRV